MQECCGCGHTNSESDNACAKCGNALLKRSIGTVGQMVGGPHSAAQVSNREQNREEKAQELKDDLGQEALG